MERKKIKIGEKKIGEAGETGAGPRKIGGRGKSPAPVSSGLLLIVALFFFLFTMRAWNRLFLEILFLECF